MDKLLLPHSKLVILNINKSNLFNLLKVVLCVRIMEIE